MPKHFAASCYWCGAPATLDHTYHATQFDAIRKAKDAGVAAYEKASPSTETSIPALLNQTANHDQPD